MVKTQNLRAFDFRLYITYAISLWEGKVGSESVLPRIPMCLRARNHSVNPSGRHQGGVAEVVKTYRASHPWAITSFRRTGIMPRDGKKEKTGQFVR